MSFFRAVLITFSVFGALSPAFSQVRIGQLFSFSGPFSGISIQARDGFNLALRSLGGRLGDVDVQMFSEDDEGKVDLALVKAKILTDKEKVDFVIGPLLSDLVSAVVKPVTDTGAILISPRAGPASLAGKQCHESAFVLSHQSEQLIETLGRFAEDAGLKRVVVVAGDDEGGNRARKSFRHQYFGETLAELGVPSSSSDLRDLILRIAALQPSAVMVLLTGQQARDFLSEWQRAGMVDKAALYSLALFDQALTSEQQVASLGVFGAGIWTPGLGTPETGAFVSAFEAEYGYSPSVVAFEAYDAAMLIDSAVRRVKGNLGDREALRGAVKMADFKSLRGGFIFGNNNFPVQDFYVVKNGRRLDGRIQPEIIKRVFTQFGDAYASECPLK